MKRVVSAVLAAMAVTAGGAQQASAQQLQGLSITMSGGAAQVHPGDRLPYTVTVRGTDGKAHPDTRVELTLPVGARAGKLAGGGKAPEPWFAAWTLAVPADGAMTVSAEFVAGEPAAGTKGYTASACIVANAVRLTCATRIEQLAGAADVHAVAAPSSDGDSTWWWPVGAAVLALAVLGVARWRRKPAVAATEDEPVALSHNATS